MKQFLITFSILIGLGFGIYLVVGLFSPEPPLPILTIDEKELEVARGSYCWEGVFNGVCADTISPPELIEHHNIKPVMVSPESELKIEFEKEPDENTVGVTRWLSNGEVEDVPLNRNIMIAPEEKGVYIYDVHASWEKGSSSYVFIIEVP